MPFMFMGESEIAKFDGALSVLCVTLAIMMFSSLTSACTTFLACRYCSAARSCRSTSTIYFYLKVPKRCLRAKRESSAYSRRRLMCVSEA